jgi:hypothetical protein
VEETLVHVQLTKSVADKMLILSGRSGKSVNELVNILLACIDEVEHEEEITLLMSQKVEPQRDPPKPPHRIIRRINWSTKL